MSKNLQPSLKLPQNVEFKIFLRHPQALLILEISHLNLGCNILRWTVHLRTKRDRISQWQKRNTLLQFWFIKCKMSRNVSVFIHSIFNSLINKNFLQCGVRDLDSVIPTFHFLQETRVRVK